MLLLVILSVKIVFVVESTHTRTCLNVLGENILFTNFKNKTHTIVLKTITILMLTLGLTSISAAYAAPVSTPPELVSVGVDGKFYPESDGVVRLEFANNPPNFQGFLLTSWDKVDGRWSTPQEMTAAYDGYLSCLAAATANMNGADATAVADDCLNQNGFPVYNKLSSTSLGQISGIEFTPTVSGPENMFAVSMWRVDNVSNGLGYSYVPSEPLFFTLDVVLGPQPRNSSTTVPTTPDASISNDINVTPEPIGFVEETAGFFSKTVFSALRTLGAPAAEIGLAATTAGLVVVLSLLVGFPTQMLNSTIEANRDRFKTPRWFANAAVYLNGLLAKVSKTKSGSKKFQTIKAYLIIILSSFIAGFVQPDFGFNLMSVRLVLTVFAAFLIINIGSSYVMYLVGKRYGESEKPQIKARPAYILFVLITVLFSRLVDAEPAIVFGALLAVELSTRVSENKKLRSELYALLYVVCVGLVGWILFMVTFKSNTGLSVIASEFGSVVTVEALSTLPILLLPMRFMFGSKIWNTYGWKKWLTLYAAGLFVFSFVLMPMPFSWDVIDVPFVSWVAVLSVYALFSFIVWKYFQNKTLKEESVQE